MISVMLVAPTLGASWTGVDIQTASCFDDDPIGVPGGLVTPAPGTAVVIYSNDSDEFWPANVGLSIRRSTDSGITWGTPAVLSTETTGGMALGGLGAHVDAVWVDKRADQDAAEIRYAHSGDSGFSFSPSTTLASPALGYPRDVSEARVSDDVVAIAYTIKQGSWAATRVRVSVNGGTTFSRSTVLATGQVRDVRLAVADGVIYAVYMRRAPDGPRSIEFRRSADDGATWTPTRRFARNVFNGAFSDVDTAPTITAEGSEVYVGYVSTTRKFWYRRSVDHGQTWSAAARLSGVLKQFRVEMSMQGGVVRVSFDRRTDSYYDSIRYRESTDATTWSTPDEVAWSDIGMWVAGVGYTGNIIVLYMLHRMGRAVRLARTSA